MLSGELLKSHFAKFDLAAMLSGFLEQSHFDKEKFKALRRDGFKSLDKSQREELLKIAGFKAYLDAKFQGFLRELMQSKILVVSGTEYKFSELEIYTCFDANTYKRSCEAGEIYFHNFGFDISFKSEPALYGGILVRSLKPLKERNFIFGPRKCALCILNAKVQNLNFDLKEADFREDEVAFTPRIRSFKDETELKNDALRAVSGEFRVALTSAKEYKKELKMPIKRGEIYLFIGFDAEKFSPKMLSRKERRRLKRYPNLANSNSFKLSRYLKFKAKKRSKICLSHKENIAVLAISKEKVGVDVEEIKERNFDGVIKFCFNKKESEIYANAKDKMQKFYEIYTAKEAVIKAKNLAFSDLPGAKFDEMDRRYLIINNLFIICLAFKHCKDIIVKFL